MDIIDAWSRIQDTRIPDVTKVLLIGSIFDQNWSWIDVVKEAPVSRYFIEELRHDILWLLSDDYFLSELRHIYKAWRLRLDRCPSLLSIRQRSNRARLAILNTNVSENSQPKTPLDLIRSIPGIIYPDTNVQSGIELITKMMKSGIENIGLSDILWEIHELFYEKTPPCRSWRNQRLLTSWAEGSVEIVHTNDYHYIPHTAIPYVMGAFFEQVNEAWRLDNDFEKRVRILELMYIFNRIHPFYDGNWRTCMLYFNIILEILWLPIFTLSEKELKTNHAKIFSPDITDFVEWAMKKQIHNG